LKDSDKKIIKEFATSNWMDVYPYTPFPENWDGHTKVYSSKGYSTEETKLFSFVFNAFVFMQVFNQINARKLELGEWNVFSGMCTNLPFLGIMIVTIGVQLLMVEYGGRMVKCWPLNMY
jgi:magnesium-transporting ATPase (P-type)